MDSTKPLAKVEDHVYEDIDPEMEWVKNDGFDTLLVHLPGFTKQQIKIQANTGEQKLKITGESHQGDNKWIRFKKKLTVSSDYDLNQVRARFAGGVLYIKHPKKITSPTKPVQENNADPSVEPQKPAKPDDQNSGQDPAAQEVPPKTEVEGQTRGDIDGKTNATSTEANLKDQKSDYVLPEEGKATGTSEKHETGGGGGLVANKKQLRISPTVVVSTGLFLLVIVLALALALGLYVRKAMRSQGEYES